MGHPALKLGPRATYADLEAVARTKVAELIHGTLHILPRPAPRHARALTSLTGRLHGPFDLGEGGPGGWWILDEPELHFPDPTAPGEDDAIVPDLAAWRRERMPRLPKETFWLAPDWVCEILSQSTEDVDRDEKMPIYARQGVRHAWLIDPVAQTLEVVALGADGAWGKPEVHRDFERVRVEPFAAIEIDLSVLWG
jgi:hypothetical protein